MLVVAPDEKVLVCYLLRRMRDRLPAGQCELWLTAIFERLRINRATFISKLPKSASITPRVPMSDLQPKLTLFSSE